MTDRDGWRTDEVLGWTRADAPAPPRSFSPWLTAALGGTLVAVLGGILASDTLCPEHRLWVQTLATLALASSITAVVQVLRAQSSAPVFALAGACLGVGIGLVDAVHAPTRGRLVALGFAAVAVLAAFMALRLRGLRAWDRSLTRAHRAAGEPTPAVAAHEPIADTTVAAPVTDATEAGDRLRTTAEQLRS